ncbi:MAG: alpha/beta fold hydrolase [Clostridia bacterium]|nr:alpha/beta fold hydrolase [Clostridia bacterium]
MINVVLIVLGVLFVLVMTAGFYMARFACLRKKVPDYWTNPDAMPPIYEHVPEADHPGVLAGREFLRSHAQPPVYITSRDGLRLQGHYVPPEGDPKGIFLQVHGYRSHPLCDFSGCARGMHAKGYGLFLIDHRASGGSEGKYITFGLLERYDIADWCAYLKNRFPDVPVMLDGVSMGGATVMLTAGEALPDTVRGIIADCGYSSPAAICKKVLKQWFRLPPFPIYYASVLWIRLLAGVWFSLPGKSERARYLTGDCGLALEKNRIPIVIAHGEADGFVPCSMSVENFAHCDPAHSELLTVPGAEHGIAWLADRERYNASIYRMWEKIHGEPTV